MRRTIRLTPIVSDHGDTFTASRDGVLLFTTGNRADAADRLADLGVENSLPLVEAAEHWGAVDIHELAGL